MKGTRKSTMKGIMKGTMRGTMKSICLSFKGCEAADFSGMRGVRR
ncbi:hypothetical protein [Methanosarcina acetivorans]|nr:hypothetical protein [Methanosarcina acetivorans]